MSNAQRLSDDPTRAFEQGNQCYGQGQFEAALACYDRAIAARPDFIGAFRNRGIVAQALGRYEAAIQDFQHCLEVNPNNLDVIGVTAFCWHSLGRFDIALPYYQHLRRLKPGDVECRYNEGAALYALGRIEEARQAYEEVVRIQPQHPGATLGLGFVKLIHGDYAAGWAFYKRHPARVADDARRGFRQPEWVGDVPLAGKRLLILPEDGLGETLHFCRYALMAEAQGAKVFLVVPRPLLRLACRLSPGISVIPVGDPFPDFDLHCSVMSLMLGFKTTLETVPAHVPYLSAFPEDVARWAGRFASADRRHKKPRVGIVWAGAVGKPYDRFRSLSLKALEPILLLPEIDFYSLQKAENAPEVLAELREGPWRDRVVDWTDELQDFADTAAFVMHLDLVITVDTAMVHLAGALGKPVWMLDRLNNCWRWVKGRTDNPWYPTLRIFRQECLGAWDEPVRRVAEALSAWVSGHGGQAISLPSVLADADKARVRGDMDQAERGYRAILKEFPEHVDALFGLAVVCRAQGRFADAVRCYEQVIAQKPDYAEAYSNQGNALFDLGEHKRALSAYEQALALKPDSLSSATGVGLCLDQLSRPVEALAAWDRVLSLSPPGQAESFVYNSRGIILMGLGRWEEASASFQRLLDRNSADPVARQNMALLYQKQARQKNAPPSHGMSG